MWPTSHCVKNPCKCGIAEVSSSVHWQAGGWKGACHGNEKLYRRKVGKEWSLF